jgi:hypothetical protein
LLEGYCQAIIAGREAFDHISSEGYVTADGSISLWVSVWEKSGRAAVAFASKLRLCPQSRHDAKRAAREREFSRYGNPITPAGIGGWPARKRLALDD